MRCSSSVSPTRISMFILPLLPEGAARWVWSARLAPPTVPGTWLFRAAAAAAAAAGAEECPSKQWGISLSRIQIGESASCGKIQTHPLPQVSSITGPFHSLVRRYFSLNRRLSRSPFQSLNRKFFQKNAIGG